MAIRSNGFYNNADIGQGFSNLASMFAPSSPQEVAMGANVQLRTAEAARNAAAIAAAPEEQRPYLTLSPADGIKNWIAQDMHRRATGGASWDDLSRLRFSGGTNFGDTATGALAKPFVANESQRLPPALAAAYGVPADRFGVIQTGDKQTSTLPGRGGVIRGPDPTAAAVMASGANGTPAAAEDDETPAVPSRDPLVATIMRRPGGDGRITITGKSDEPDRPLTDAERAGAKLKPDAPAVMRNGQVTALGGGVTVNTGDKANATLDNSIIDDIVASKRNALGAVGTLTAVSRQKEALDKGIISGFGSDYQTQARSFVAKMLGLDDAGVVESEKFDAAASQKGAELARQISNAGHTTNADLAVGRVIAGGDRNKIEASLRGIIAAQEQLALDTIRRHGVSVAKIKSIMPDAAARADYFGVDAPTVYQYGANAAPAATSGFKILGVR